MVSAHGNGTRSQAKGETSPKATPNITSQLVADTSLSRRRYCPLQMGAARRVLWSERQKCRTARHRYFSIEPDFIAAENSSTKASFAATNLDPLRFK